jgi:hypothetical protein
VSLRVLVVSLQTLPSIHATPAKELVFLALARLLRARPVPQEAIFSMEVALQAAHRVIMGVLAIKLASLVLGHA